MMPALDTSAPTEPTGNQLDRAPRRFFLGDVAFDQNDATQVSAIAALEPGSRQIQHSHAPAVVQQALRNGPADAVRGPGDDCDRSLGARHGSGLRLDRKIVA
jgi:hypothetical protein